MGRPRGAKNRAALATQLLLDGQAEALTNKAVELALGGDMAALRLCLARIAAPRREAPVQFDLPPLDSLDGAAGAMTAITTAAADGAITPGEAFALSRVIDTLLRALAAREAERRQRRFWAGRREIRSDLDARPRRRFSRAPPGRAPRSVQLAAKLLQDRCGLMAGGTFGGAHDILLERRRGGPQIAELAV